MSIEYNNICRDNYKKINERAQTTTVDHCHAIQSEVGNDSLVK